MATRRLATWHLYHTVVVVGVILAIILLFVGTAYYSWPIDKKNSASALTTWYIMIGLLVLFIFFIGHGITKRVLGALIDGRNKMSLSRLQLIVWTILILAAWITAALWNLTINKTSPLAIALPSQVWLLLGISTASFVGTPLILNNKTNKPANNTEWQRQLLLKKAQQPVAKAMPTPPVEANAPPMSGLINDLQNQRGANPAPALDAAAPPDPTSIVGLQDQLGLDLQGQVPYNKGPDQASLANLFEGDEVGNVAQLDLSKIQLFLFTLILVLTYGAALSSMFASADSVNGITNFPPLDQSMIVLLGISHAGYLSYKASPHSVLPGSQS